jgi:leader peptidase (prepilin peptidase)/N-methyltransferase
MNDLNVVAPVLVIMFSLLIGSFFNVVIYRLPRNLSIAWPPSHCPGCDRPIRPIENIPVLSYIFLQGRCAGCKMRISLQYPVIELLTSIMAIILWYAIIRGFCMQPHPWWDFIALGLQIASILVLIPVSAIDIEHYIIPDSITLFGGLAGIAVAWLPGGITPLEMGFGIVAGGGSLLGIGLIGEFVLKKEAMGMGDVKLMAFLGSLWGWKPALLAIVFASFLGSIVGGALIATHRMNKAKPIPFGPFLAAGMVLAILWGNALVDWYFGLMDRLINL